MCCLIHLCSVCMVVLLKSYLEKIKEHFIIVKLFYVHCRLQAFPLTLSVICSQPCLVQADSACFVRELLNFIITPNSTMLVNEQCRNHCALRKRGGCLFQSTDASDGNCSACVMFSLL